MGDRSVSTPLRPVYAGLFPTFGTGDLAARLERMPPHLATLLTIPNIRTMLRVGYSDWWSAYVALPSTKKAAMLAESLQHVGFSRAIGEAIEAVPREDYCRVEDRDLAYLNSTLALDVGSALSAPGLVAYYLSDLIDGGVVNGDVREVGTGSGYHAALVAMLLPKVSIVSYEANLALVEPARARLDSLSVDVEVIARPATRSEIEGWHKVAAIYSTAAAPIDMLDVLTSRLRVGGRVTYVRPLREREFNAQPIDPWLGQTFGSYDGYAANGGSLFCAVSSDQKTAEDVTHIRDLYGVSFVPWLNESRSSDSPERIAEVDEFKASLLRRS